jgi:hypothetical protein
MHKKYARDGLAAVSVSVDPLEDGVQERVLKFLQSKGATFTNLILDEPSEVWQEKLHFASVPTVFVFSRDGKWTQFTEDKFNYDDVEKLVVELLKKK